MAKSRSHRKVMKTIEKTLPMVNKGLNRVGIAAKNVATASIPVVEKGVSAVYGTMASGFDLGIKGVKSVSKSVKTMSKKRKSRRSHKGGKKTRRH